MTAPKGSYETDGLCHNALNPQANRLITRECRRRAAWIGVDPVGFRSGFCDQCKEIATFDAARIVSWEVMP